MRASALFASLVRRLSPAALLALPIALSACTASLDLERFKKSEQSVQPGTSTAQYSDVRFTAQNMTSHINEYFEIRVVDKANRVQAKAVYFGVSNPDFTIYMRRLIPKAATNAPYRLDFWADHNNSGKYDGIEGGINDKDHAWRRTLDNPLPEDVRQTGDRYELTFLHDTNFVDIFTDLGGNKIDGKDTLLNFDLKVVGAGAFVGKMIEIRVVDKASGRLVALHRRGAALESYPAQVLGVLDEETTYEISAYVDANSDGKYSAGDPSWRVELASTAQGIGDNFDLATLPQTPIDTGESATAAQ